MAKKNHSQSNSKPLAMRIFVLVVAGIMALSVVASAIMAIFV